MGMGKDAGAEFVEEEGFLGAFPHEEVGDAAFADDGGGGGSVGEGVGEGFGGGFVAGEVFPVEGGDGGDSGMVIQHGGEVRGGEDARVVGVGGGGDGGVGKGGEKLGGEGVVLEHVAENRVDVFAGEPVGEVGRVVEKGEGELPCEGDGGKGAGEAGEKAGPGRGGRRDAGVVVRRGDRQDEEKRRDGGKGFPAVLPKVEGQEHAEKREGEEDSPGEGAAEETQDHEGGEKREEDGTGEGETRMAAIVPEREEFEDVAGVEAEHEGGTGDVPRDGAEEDEEGKGGGGGEGEDRVEEEGERQGLALVAEAHEEEQAFADAEEGQGIEGVVGLEAHGEVVGGVFEEPEEEGGECAGEAPETPGRGSDERRVTSEE
jgi:hypothetical protein